jgi:hypothetical protein
VVLPTGSASAALPAAVHLQVTGGGTIAHADLAVPAASAGGTIKTATVSTGARSHAR